MNKFSISNTQPDKRDFKMRNAKNIKHYSVLGVTDSPLSCGNTFTAGLLAVLQVEEQMFNLGHFGRMDEFAFVHHLPGERGDVCAGVETLQSYAENTQENTKGKNDFI